MIVTACVLTCNELIPLQRCLQSIKGHVDDIIIAIDDKTTDGTERWLIDNGYKNFYKFHFENSFALARNKYIERVKTPWFFTIDSDETMLEKDAKQLREVCRDGDRRGTDAFAMPRRHWFNLEMTSEWTAPYPDKHMRLMRTHCRYRGRVHEQYINWHKMEVSSLEIQHFNTYYRTANDWAVKTEFYQKLRDLS